MRTRLTDSQKERLKKLLVSAAMFVDIAILLPFSIFYFFRLSWGLSIAIALLIASLAAIAYYTDRLPSID